MKTLQTLLIAAFALFSSPLFGDEMKKDVALGGYCPVCYVAAGKAVKGTSEFKVEHEDKTYYFVSQDAVDAFTKEPAKFLPAYDGYCAFGIAHGKKFESDPTVFKVIDGVIYLNKDKEIGAKFAEDTAGFITKADATWKKMMMEKAEKKEMMKK
jgi:YHS domain-containing protein